MCKAVSRSGPLLHVSICGTREHTVGGGGETHQRCGRRGEGFRQAMACTYYVMVLLAGWSLSAVLCFLGANAG